MREIVLNITIKTEILHKQELITVPVGVVKDLLEDDSSIANYINEYMEDYMRDNYCSCSFNESKNHCDCGCGDWNYDYDIIEINSEIGGQL